MSKKNLKIWFTDFNIDFNPQDKNNYFTKLLSRKYEVEITTENPDLVFYSVYGLDYKQYPDVKKIFYTSKNYKPYGDYIAAFSYDYNEDAQHLRLPAYSVYSFEEETYHKIYPQRYRLNNPLSFCTLLTSNITTGKGALLRRELYLLLNKYKRVQSAGREMKNIEYPQLQGRHGHEDWRMWKQKILELEKSKFAIVTESESTEGYTSEKIYDALANGITPIYWGNPSIGRDFNEGCLINVHKYKNLQELLSYIKFLDKYPGRLAKYYNTPILSNQEHFQWFNHDRILDKLQEVIETKKYVSIIKDVPANIRIVKKVEPKVEKVEEVSSNFINSPIVSDNLQQDVISNRVYNIVENLKNESKVVNIITPNDYFDEIYCLNLNRRPDRWLKMYKRFRDERIFVTRVEAVDGKTEEIKKQWKAINYKGDIAFNQNSYAIKLSYQKIFQNAIDRKLDKILIFEDDIIFHKNFENLFNESIKNIPGNWDMWYLGATIQKGHKDMPINDYFGYANQMDGYFAIAFRVKFIEDNLSLFINNKNAIDTITRTRLQTDPNNVILTSRPLLIEHDEGWSDNFEFNVRPRFDKNIYRWW